MNIRGILRTNEQKMEEVQDLLRRSVPLVRELQLAVASLVTLNLTPEDVIKKVNSYFGIDVLRKHRNGKLSRVPEVSLPRHLVRYILYEFSPLPLTEIATATGSIDKHSITLSSVKVIKGLLTYDDRLKAALYTIVGELIEEKDLMKLTHKIYKTKRRENGRHNAGEPIDMSNMWEQE